MADNKKLIEEKVETDIDPNGPPNSILAQNHQDILKAVLNQAGKYTGSPYIAKKDESTIPTGIFSWEGNAMNVLTPFDIKVSKLTADLNDFGNILSWMFPNGIIKFKDYVGRSVFLEFLSFVSGDDGFGNDIYTITVKGFAESPNYIYQDTEQQICMLEMFTGTGAGSLSTTEQFTSTLGQTIFNLSNSPNNVDVYVDRVRQINTIDYTLLTNVVTLTDALDAGSIVEIRKF